MYNYNRNGGWFAGSYSSRVVSMIRAKSSLSFLFFSLFSFVALSFSSPAYAGCPVGESCNPEITGSLTYRVELRDVSNTHKPASFDATVSFKDRFITVSVGGLQRGLWTPKLVLARGFALVSSGSNSKPDRVVLSNRGRKPNVVLAADNKLKPMGPQSVVEFTVEVLPDIVFPMGVAN
jgi:hypothetical protein